MDTTNASQKLISLRIGISDFLSIFVVGYLILVSSGLLNSSFIVFYTQNNFVTVSYFALTTFLVCSFVFLITFNGSRKLENLGHGSYEYLLLTKASIYLLLFSGVAAFVLNAAISRLFFFSFFILVFLALMLTRLFQRKWLSKQRGKGKFLSSVLLVGSLESVSTIAQELTKYPEGGYLPAGICTDSATNKSHVEEVPILGRLSDIEAVFGRQLEAIIISDTSQLGQERVKEIGWFLEPLDKKLIISPNLLDIAGPRIHTRPLAGLSLIEISVPNSSSFQWWIKRIFDLVSSTLLMLLLLPLGLVIAVIIKSEDGGPIFFKQKRVGVHGSLFEMYKFRSMRVDAEKLKSGLVRDDKNSILFKMKNDPRVTRCGRTLRKFSLDELPQLFNVLLGNMSMVGPRPPLLSEVEQYDQKLHRKFLVRPGITGLWQVSGRSNLSWDESVRLDLYYVENWSLVSDFFILLKTFKAVFVKDGAY